MAGFPCISWLSHIPFQVFFLCSSVDRHLGCFRILTTVNKAVLNVECRDRYEILISIPLDTYPTVELLDHLVDLFLISFFRNSTNFMGVFDVSICIPTKKPRGSLFFHTLPVLAWKIPWTEEPGRLPSMGLHRVGHNWSDLAAANTYLCFLFFCFF